MRTRQWAAARTSSRARTWCECKITLGNYEVTERSRTSLHDDRLRFHSRWRVVPEIDDGGLGGVRLFGVRNDDILGALGLENGDELVSVGGKPIDSPEARLAAIATLAMASAVTAGIVRRGVPLELAYRVVPR